MISVAAYPLMVSNLPAGSSANMIDGRLATTRATAALLRTYRKPPTQVLLTLCHPHHTHPLQYSAAPFTNGHTKVNPGGGEFHLSGYCAVHDQAKALESKTDLEIMAPGAVRHIKPCEHPPSKHVVTRCAAAEGPMLESRADLPQPDWPESDIMRLHLEGHVPLRFLGRNLP